ncbi:MAG: 50S ribosomal protein L21 [Bryobacteraceae bacterium]|jgi:large subunit ribosomal protein L21|nr:50S ribosomal protein L21 [Bryobacteraceae bacterium]
MYAVIETGGKQYRVSPGDVLLIERLEGENGAAVEFNKVLAVGTDSGELRAGSDASGAKVTGTIQAQERGDKLVVFKFKRKKQYKRTIGHRQNLTRVKIAEILA